MNRMPTQLRAIFLQLETLSTTSLFHDSVVPHPCLSALQPNILSHRNTPKRADSRDNQQNRKAACSQNSKQTANCSTTNSQAELLDNLGNNTRTNSSTTFTNREAASVNHSNLLTQSHTDLNIITWHAHFSTIQKIC